MFFDFISNFYYYPTYEWVEFFGFIFLQIFVFSNKMTVALFEMSWLKQWNHFE